MRSLRSLSGSPTVRRWGSSVAVSNSERAGQIHRYCRPVHPPRPCTFVGGSAWRRLFWVVAALWPLAQVSGDAARSEVGK
jgi:hypothetical protein